MRSWHPADGSEILHQAANRYKFFPPWAGNIHINIYTYTCIYVYLKIFQVVVRRISEPPSLPYTNQIWAIHFIIKSLTCMFQPFWGVGDATLTFQHHFGRIFPASFNKFSKSFFSVSCLQCSIKRWSTRQLYLGVPWIQEVEVSRDEVVYGSNKKGGRLAGWPWRKLKEFDCYAKVIFLNMENRHPTWCFFTKFAISPVPGADFQGEVLILPSEVLQSNLSGQVGLLFSCPSSQVVNLWEGYHLQKICQDVTESHACSKYQWQPLKRFFLAQSDVFYGDAFQSQKTDCCLLPKL